MSKTTSRGTAIMRVIKSTRSGATRSWQPDPLSAASDVPSFPVGLPHAGPETEPSPLPPPVENPAERQQAIDEAVSQALETERAERQHELEALRAEHEAEAARHHAEEAKLRSYTRRLTAALRAGLADLNAVRSAATVSLEPRVACLALEIAGRALGQAVLRGEHDVKLLVGRLLADARCRYQGAECVLRLHPEDAQLLESLQLEGDVQLVADPQLRRGDARVETDDGWVWDGVFARLDELSRVLIEEEPRQWGRPSGTTSIRRPNTERSRRAA